MLSLDSLSLLLFRSDSFPLPVEQYYKPVESIDDFLSLFVQMADQPGGVLTRKRLRQVCIWMDSFVGFRRPVHVLLTKCV
jgi:hypothetical protein